MEYQYMDDNINFQILSLPRLSMKDRYLEIWTNLLPIKITMWGSEDYSVELTI